MANSCATLLERLENSSSVRPPTGIERDVLEEICDFGFNFSVVVLGFLGVGVLESGTEEAGLF